VVISDLYEPEVYSFDNFSVDPNAKFHSFLFGSFRDWNM